MKRNCLYLMIAVVSSMVIVSCNGLKKMDKLKEELGADATPEPLEVHGDSIDLKITGKFPEKYFAKKVYAEATPVLVYEGGETAFKMKSYQGEKAVGNGDVIPFKTGKAFNYASTIAYKPAMDNSTLQLRIHGKQGSKEADFEPMAIGTGVITTPYLMKSDDKIIGTDHKCVPFISKKQDAIINFDYNSSAVKPAELKQSDIADLGKFIDSCARNPKLVITSIVIESYASPEGELMLNDGLAQERAEAGKKILADLIKKMKLTNVAIENVTLTPKGEDWDGFSAAMTSSNIEDRNIILNVLQMTKDFQQREKEIKNISKTYTEIQKVIFPSLRRATIRVNYNEMGLTDQELLAMSASNPSSLKYEELMKAGTLVEGLDQKIAIYTAATAKSDADYRSHTNLGNAYYMQNKMADAEAAWTKAYANKKTAETSNNMGVATRIKGDRKAALTYLNEAGSQPETQYNKGLIDIQNGNYSAAISKFGSYKTFNSALAKVLNKDNGGATSDLDASKDTSGLADYLRAIIAARSNESSAVVNNLKSAVQKDSALGSKAKKDMEFRNFKDAMNF